MRLSGFSRLFSGMLLTALFAVAGCGIGYPSALLAKHAAETVDGAVAGPVTHQEQICTVGTEACDGVCVNLNTDPHNCGACGQVCGAGKICSHGACHSRATAEADAGASAG